MCNIYSWFVLDKDNDLDRKCGEPSPDAQCDFTQVFLKN